jgi:glycosyltransferase involved in cell wall biosynthesis
MNILHTECGLNWGGQEYRTLLEHLYLNANGHRSWLMCHPESPIYRNALALGAPNVVPVNLRRTWRIDIAFSIYAFCLRHGIDVINTHGSRDSTLCLPSFMLGIPLIRSRQVIHPIQKCFSYKYVCSHLIVSAVKIQALLENSGVPKEKISAVDEGVDLQEFHPGQDVGNLREEFKLGDQDTVIVNVGMLREDKGQKYFLDAANLLLKDYPTLKFFLVGGSSGDPILESELRGKICEYGIGDNFIMTGYRQDIADFMRLADFIVIASTEEAQSRIAPQAFASGKTVVSTDVGGLPEVVKDGENGLLVPAKDAGALARAMSTLLQDHTLKDRLKKNAYHYAQERLSISSMMDKILQIYGSFVAKNALDKAV